MSEGEGPPSTPAGGRPFPGRPVDAMASPAAVAGSLNTPLGFNRTTAPTAEESAKMRFARHAVSPLPWLAASAALVVATIWAFHWSEFERGAPDPVRSSEWWANVNAVLLPANEVRVASYSQFRMWVTLGILVATALVIAGWIGRLGRNLRPDHAPFGSILPVLALPAWWMLPVTLGITAPGIRSRSDLLVRYLLAFGMLFAQFLLLRWPVLNRIWRAGRLRYDLVSIVLWLPMLIPWSMLLLSTIYSLMVTDDGDSVADSAWRPTDAMADWARALTHATEAGVLALLVVVTACQQIGILRDRAEERARRDELSAAGLPVV